MIKTDILFTGYYGMKNTGDDAFVEVASWGTKKYWQNKKCKFLAPEPLLPKTIVPAKGLFYIPKTYEYQKNTLLKNTEYLISAGGSTIHSELRNGNIKKYALDLKERHKKLKVGAIGVSIGPFKTARDESGIKKYLKEIDFLAVRDQRSFDFASSLDLPYKPVNAFDLAALLPGIYNTKAKELLQASEQKIIGISICPVESVHGGNNLDNETRRNTQIIDLIKNLDSKENIIFRFFIINGNSRNGDLALTKNIIAKSSPKNFEIIGYKNETKVMWDYIASCDFVLATRLHAGIFACFANVPFILIEYHNKCTDFLNSVGYSKELMIGDANFEISEIGEKILNCVNNKANFLVPAYLQEMQKKSLFNFTEVKI